jgi:HAD superfamily hydrolase (TIGR01549 family)
MPIKAIFYDFDGVIKDSTDIKSQAFYELYLPYGKGVADKVMQHHIEHGGMSRFEKFKYYHNEFLKKTISELEVDGLANAFSDLVLKKVIESNYVPGALESIKFGANHFKQFVVTGTPQSEIEFIVNKLSIADYFIELCGSPKKKIQHSQELLNKFGFAVDEVIFVGDALTDYECAQYFDFNFYLREHPENVSLFKDKKVFKGPDLIPFLNYIMQL